MKVKVHNMYKQKESTERRFFVPLGDVDSIEVHVKQYVCQFNFLPSTSMTYCPLIIKTLTVSSSVTG